MYSSATRYEYRTLAIKRGKRVSLVCQLKRTLATPVYGVPIISYIKAISVLPILYIGMIFILSL